MLRKNKFIAVCALIAGLTACEQKKDPTQEAEVTSVETYDNLDPIWIKESFERSTL